jgi:ATP-dependent DNA helicase RecG
MKMKEITLAESRDLCCRQEGHFFERKAVGVSGQKIQKAVVAFANADGGELVVGISDASDSREQRD